MNYFRQGRITDDQQKLVKDKLPIQRNLGADPSYRRIYNPSLRGLASLNISL